jgi:AcrR family transcriptional regulator
VAKGEGVGRLSRIAERNAAVATDRFSRKRDAILDASTEILNRRGVKGLTLGVAAAAVGLSTTSVTYYFKRKDDLAAACILRGIDWLGEMVAAALTEPTPETRLYRLLSENLDRLRLTAAGEAPAMPVMADILALNEPQRSEVVGAYVKLFRKARGLFDAQELAGLSHGRRTARTHVLLEQLHWAPAWIHRYDPQDYGQVRDRMFAILVEGLAPVGASWAPTPLPLAEAGESEARETFLVAATKLINTRGYRGASVDKISAELNVTKGSFYHHNDAKDDLVVACFNRTFDVVRKAQRLASHLPADRWTQLVSAAAALAEHQLSDHGPLLLTAALSALPEPIRREMLSQAARISDRFAEMISEGVVEGSIRPVDPTIASHMLNATVNAGANLGFWVRGVSSRAAPAVFVRPFLMGIFGL